MNTKIPKNKRLWLLSCIVVIVLFCLLAYGINWWKSIESQAHITPSYPKENIGHLIQKPAEQERRNIEPLSSSDYELLLEQTGLGRAAVDFLFANNRQQELPDFQEKYFADVSVECSANTVITREERLAEYSIHPSIPCVENGDILITFNCHALGWRNGHAAMVVDAEKRLTLEARVLGTDTEIISMDHWENYPSFAVLRLKNATKEQREEIAAYAVKCLTGIPYRLEAGVVERLASAESSVDTLTGTHCAHLVWYAYNQFGYDLDSDGGIIVTPRDLYESPHLEIIQMYGMPLSDN